MNAPYVAEYNPRKLFSEQFPQENEEGYLNWLDEEISLLVTKGYRLIRIPKKIKNRRGIGERHLFSYQIETPSGKTLAEEDIENNLEGKLIFGDPTQIESVEAWHFLSLVRANDFEIDPIINRVSGALILHPMITKSRLSA